MVETDAPFLTPHPHRGKRNEPYALPYTVRALAPVAVAGPLELCERVSTTTRRVYGLPVHRATVAGSRWHSPIRPQWLDYLFGCQFVAPPVILP